MAVIKSTRVTVGNRNAGFSVYPAIRELFDADMSQVEIDYDRERLYLFMNDGGEMCLQYQSEGSTHIAVLD